MRHGGATVAALALVLSLALLAPGAVRAQQPRHFPADSDLETMLQYAVRGGEAPGIVLGVLDLDGVTRVVAYGSGGPGTRPLGPRSEFAIGSITKTFTATLLADMVLRGEVALDDPVSKYLPAGVKVPSLGGKPITLLSLATHTSGLPRNPTDYTPRDPKRPFAGFTLQDLYASLARTTLRHAPGAWYQYSNFGYGLLGVALARAAGESLPALIRQRILAPLGMSATRYVSAGDTAAPWMTRGYAHGKVTPYWVASPAIQGAGGLRSDAEDMLKYLKANAEPDTTTELGRAMKMAQRVRVPHGADGMGYGFSWRTMAPLDVSPVVMHGGNTGGFTAEIAFQPKKHLGTVLLANTAAFTDRLALQLIYPAPPPASWHARVEPGVLAQYVGEYRATMGAIRPTYYIRLDQGHLAYQPPQRQVPTRLYAKSDSTFYMLRGPWTVTFNRDTTGKVVAMVLTVDQRDRAREGTTVMTRKVSDSTLPSAVVSGHEAFWKGWGVGAWLLVGLVGVLALAAGVRAVRS